jgi:hypothetical protein
VATSVRLAEGLKGEASVYAVGVGISLNALVAIALRDYLDRRAVRGPDGLVVPAGRPIPPSTVGKPARQVSRAVEALGLAGSRKQRRARARASGGKR